MSMTCFGSDGHGLNKEKVWEYSETVLREIIIYTHDKKTIFKGLENLGRAVNKSNKRVVSPDFEDTLSENEHVTNLYKSEDLVIDFFSVQLEIV